MISELFIVYSVFFCKICNFSILGGGGNAIMLNLIEIHMKIFYLNNHSTKLNHPDWNGPLSKL